MRKSNVEGKPAASPARLRCAIYTRKSTEEGLEQEFNSLAAQREASEAFILSQRREGWFALPDRYDDGGFTGANMDRPALGRLLEAVAAGELDCVVVYKVDRLSRSLLDFTRMLSLFEKHKVSFVAVTQQFNTSTSLGRLTLNILLSFAQFERELIGERTRDKMSAARKKGRWVGGRPVLGYDVSPGGGALALNEQEAEQVRSILVYSSDIARHADRDRAPGLAAQELDAANGRLRRRFIQLLASVHSRLMVAGETLSDSAVSSMERPSKNRISTICAWSLLTRANSSMASFTSSRSTGDFLLLSPISSVR